MRSWSPFLAALFLLLGQAFALAQEPAPRVDVAEPLFEFGTVNQGAVVRHDFQIRNAGTADLVVQRVVPGCGCTASTAEPSTIKPGESGVVHVEFDTTGFSGEKLKTVRVYTNDAQQASTLLSLKGTIEPDITIEPQRVYFGTVTRGAAKDASQEVTIRVRDGVPARITGVKNYSKSLVITEQESGAKARQFTISLRDDVDLGELRDRVVVTLEGAKRGSINIPVFASIRGPVRLEPSSVAFGIIEGEEPIERSVKLENRGKGDIEILSVKSSHPAVTANFAEVKPGRVYLIKVLVDPREVKRDLRASLEVRTSDPEQKEISLSVYGILPPKI